jgi:hypothetical protein
MTDTVNLGLPFLAAAQAQKHVTHNEALRLLDTLLQLAVITRTLNAPPGAPAEGQRWIVKASPVPTGAWAGHGNHIAAWQDGAWQFSVPKTGWLAYVVDEAMLAGWSGTAWINALSLANLLLLGVNTAADATNRLAVKADAVLFNHDDVTPGTGDMRTKLNKSAAARTASLLLQDATSGRAEIGLTVDDDLHVKVSPDGASWTDALTIDRATGTVKVNVALQGVASGFKNAIINGRFRVNQRAVSGTVTLAAGAYGHDRWKAGAGGCTYSFAVSGIDTTVTITAGTLTQVIEDINVEGGVYTASWSGTAQARVYQGAPAGAYAASGFQTGSLAAGAATTIEFNTGTLTRVQLEARGRATDFERRPYGTELALCQRYYHRRTSTSANDMIGTMQVAAAGTVFGKLYDLPVTMRAAGTVTVSSFAHLSPWLANGGGTTAFTAGTLVAIQDSVRTVAGLTGSSGLVIGDACNIYFNTASGWIATDAEI